MNIFLYLTGTSAHPSGTIKGTIYGLLQRYHQQNTYYSDYIKFASVLYRNLLAQAHSRDEICPIFLEAHNKILSGAYGKQPTDLSAPRLHPLMDATPTYILNSTPTISHAV